MSQFAISDVNPNDDIGGGGCLHFGEEKSVDCEGPYVIFQNSSTDSTVSPHAVLCARCLKQVYDAVYNPEPQEPITVPESDVEELDSVPEV